MKRYMRTDHKSGIINYAPTLDDLVEKNDTCSYKHVLDDWSEQRMEVSQRENSFAMKQGTYCSPYVCLCNNS